MSHNHTSAIHELMNLGLRDPSGQTVGLERVSVHAKLQGVLMETTVRQHYRNSGPDNIEVSYVFPIAYGAMLAGMAVELNGKRLSGQVVPKYQAVKGYEKALASGDTPIMLREKSHGLYSADLGNLLPGDQAVIELRVLQTLVVSQGQARLVFPTVIAPRFGDERKGGLDLHETTRSNLMAEYGLQAELQIVDTAQSLSIKCPSHRVALEHRNGTTHVRLDESAYLDRDWVVCVEGLPVSTGYQTHQQNEHTLAMATFVGEERNTRPRPLRLKLLVDCSGSMNGVSIAQAKAVLHELASHLGEADALSLSLFGDDCVHPIQQMQSVDSRLLRLAFAPSVDSIGADMGGTQMEAALGDTIALPASQGEGRVDILLITDGAVWEIDAMLAKAQDSGHRVFCLGVGIAPAESLLRELAHKTGGHCSFVTPNEAMGPAVADLIQRMRHGQAASIQMDWGTPMDWTSHMPDLILPGEAVTVLGMSEGAVTLQPTLKGQTHEPRALPLQAAGSNTDWARLAVHRRLKEQGEHPLAATWAQAFELVGENTHYLLVHERSAHDKATDLPRLVQVEHMRVEVVNMMACYSRESTPIDYSKLSGPAVWRSPARVARTVSLETPSHGGMEDFELPAFLRKQADVPANNLTDIAPSTPANARAWQPARAKPVAAKPKMTLARSLLDLSEESLNGLLIQSFNQSALQATKLRQALPKTLATHQVDFVAPILMAAVKVIKDPAIFWCLYMQWLTETKGVSPALERHAKRLITEHLSKVPPEYQQLVIGLLERHATEQEACA